MQKQNFPEATVGALIFNQEKNILLAKSHKWNGKYVIPGGRIESWEKIEDALKREIREETGLSVFDIEFICLQESIFDSAYWKKKHFIFLDFACKTKTKKVKLNYEAQDFVWLKPKTALRIDLEPFTRKTIKEFLKRKK